MLEKCAAGAWESPPEKTGNILPKEEIFLRMRRWIKIHSGGRNVCERWMFEDWRGGRILRRSWAVLDFFGNRSRIEVLTAGLEAFDGFFENFDSIGRCITPLHPPGA
jgi:hypothetical protein